MNLQNYFLVAMPSLQDPLFKRSVVYIYEYNKNGTMGIIINKPIKQCTIEIILNKLKIISNQHDSNIKLDQPIFLGGPLSENQVFVLHTPCKGFESSIIISSQIMLTTSKDVLETLGTLKQPNNILVALGYASWVQDQLEYELMQNVWLTIPATHEILFHTPIVDRWCNTIKTLGIDTNNIINQIGHA